MLIDAYIKILQNSEEQLKVELDKNTTLIREITDAITNEDVEAINKAIEKMEQEKESVGFLNSLKKGANFLNKSPNQIFFNYKYDTSIEDKLKDFKFSKIKNDFILQNDEKHIKIIDSGDSIGGNDDCENLEEQIALMIKIAEAKGFDLKTMVINSNNQAFIDEANKQLGRVAKVDEESSSDVQKSKPIKKQRMN